MKIELVKIRGGEGFWVVKDPYVEGESLLLRPHPVCCGIGMVTGLYRGFPELGRMLEIVEGRAFGELCKATLMITSNVEEEQRFAGVLYGRGWVRIWHGPNPIHENREMTIWMKDNPDPKESRKYFNKHYEISDGVVRPTGRTTPFEQVISFEV